MKSKFVDSIFFNFSLNFPAFKQSLWLILFCMTTFIESRSLVACDILVAKANLYITIERGSKVKITAKDLLDIGYCEDRQYKVSWVLNGELMPLDSLSDKLPQFIRFHIEDLTNKHFCFGEMQLNFVDCIDDLVPKQLDTLFISECVGNGGFIFQGFDLPDSAIIIYEHFNYSVYKWSRCGVVKIGLTETKSTMFPKDSIYTHSKNIRFKITRSDNISFDFSNTILYLRPVIDSTAHFPNFDGIENPIFVCGENWKMDRNGYPREEFVLPKEFYENTCKYFDKYYVDSLIDEIDTLCLSLKIVERKWTYINWDNGRNYSFSQRIHVKCIKDNEPPIAICKKDVVEIKLDQNQIGTINGMVLDGGSTDNCNIRFITFDSLSIINSLSFGIQDTGKIIDLDIWVHDFAGNRTKCSSQIKVIENKVVSNFNPEIKSNIVLNLFPNPFEQMVQLNISSSYDSNVLISIYSNDGLSIYNKNVDIKEGANLINISELFKLNSGLYIMRCQSTKEVILIKGIKL